MFSLFFILKTYVQHKKKGIGKMDVLAVVDSEAAQQQIYWSDTAGCALNEWSWSERFV